MDRQQRTRPPAGDISGPADVPHHLIDTLVEAVAQTFDAISNTDVQLIVYANPAFCRMTGYSSDELVGETPRLLQGPRTDRRARSPARGPRANRLVPGKSDQLPPRRNRVRHGMEHLHGSRR